MEVGREGGWIRGGGGGVENAGWWRSARRIGAGCWVDGAGGEGLDGRAGAGWSWILDGGGIGG